MSEYNGKLLPTVRLSSLFTSYHGDLVNFDYAFTINTETLDYYLASFKGKQCVIDNSISVQLTFQSTISSIA